MNAEERRPEDEGLLQTSDALLDAAGEVAPAPDRILAARAALVARTSREARPVRLSLRRSWWIPVAAAIITVAVGLLVIGRGARPITFSVDGAGAMKSGFIRSAADRETTVSFTDGSSIILAAGTTGRVNEVSARGARFAVEQGHVVVHVVGRGDGGAKRDGGADYVIEAGPYRVKVTGTRFSVDWDPSRQHMLVAVTEGAVVVTGPTAEDGITVGVGDALDLGPRQTTSDARPMPQPSTSAAAAVSAAASPSVAALSSTELPKDDAPRLSWSARIAKGDFASVLSDADARGIDATLASAPLDDLMALGDAARYGGRGGVATQVLETVRKRFPGSQPASTAAFLLARAADDAGNAGRAIALYDATMSEGGAFAAEALGRKMLLVKRTSGNSAARTIAKDYLRTYPKGPYAGAAQSIVDGS